MAAKKQLVYKVGEVGQDNLFAHVFPPARVIPIVIASGETEMTRGTILYATEEGKYKKIDTENKGKARAILKDDVEVSEDTAAFAYATGDFNIHAVKGGTGAEKPDDTVILALQDHQIYLSELQD